MSQEQQVARLQRLKTHIDFRAMDGDQGTEVWDPNPVTSNHQDSSLYNVEVGIQNSQPRFVAPDRNSALPDQHEGTSLGLNKGVVQEHEALTQVGPAKIDNSPIQAEHRPDGTAGIALTGILFATELWGKVPKGITHSRVGRKVGAGLTVLFLAVACTGDAINPDSSGSQTPVPDSTGLVEGSEDNGAGDDNSQENIQEETVQEEETRESDTTDDQESADSVATSTPTPPEVATGGGENYTDFTDEEKTVWDGAVYQAYERQRDTDGDGRADGTLFSPEAEVTFAFTTSAREQVFAFVSGQEYGNFTEVWVFDDTLAAGFYKSSSEEFELAGIEGVESIGFNEDGQLVAFDTDGNIVGTRLSWKDDETGLQRAQLEAGVVRQEGNTAFDAEGNIVLEFNTDTGEWDAVVIELDPGLIESITSFYIDKEGASFTIQDNILFYTEEGQQDFQLGYIVEIDGILYLQRNDQDRLHELTLTNAVTKDGHPTVLIGNVIQIRPDLRNFLEQFKFMNLLPEYYTEIHTQSDIGRQGSVTYVIEIAAKDPFEVGIPDDEPVTIIDYNNENKEYIAKTPADTARYAWLLAVQGNLSAQGLNLTLDELIEGKEVELNFLGKSIQVNTLGDLTVVLHDSTSTLPGTMGPIVENVTNENDYIGFTLDSSGNITIHARHTLGNSSDKTPSEMVSRPLRVNIAMLAYLGSYMDKPPASDQVINDIWHIIDPNNDTERLNIDSTTLNILRQLIQTLRIEITTR